MTASPPRASALLYFLYYGNVGTYLPFFAAYLQGLGFTGEQIGAIQMLPSFPLAPIVAIAWATLADHRSTPQRALRRATRWVALAVLLPAVRPRAARRSGAVVVLRRSATARSCRSPTRSRSSGPRANPGAVLRAHPALRLARLRRAHGRGRAGCSRCAAAGPRDPLVPLVVVALRRRATRSSRAASRRRRATRRAPAPRDLLALLRDRAAAGLLLACRAPLGRAARRTTSSSASSCATAGSPTT